MSVAGWLEKKSGGKEGSAKSRLFEKWDRRWFALDGSVLSYYKSEDDQKKGKTPQGFIEVKGAEVFLKEVKGVAFRFTVKTAARELKLRASTPADYHMWSSALSPLASRVGELRERGETYVGDDEDDASPQISPPSHPLAPSISGWLEKKSGGKEGAAKSKLFDHWDRRWFALIGSQLQYFKSEEELRNGRPALGALECSGATVFLKEVKGQTFRFTVRSEERELKLRAATAAEYQSWTRALAPLANRSTVALSTEGERDSELPEPTVGDEGDGEEDEAEGEEEESADAVGGLPSFKEAAGGDERDPYGLGPAISGAAPSSKPPPAGARTASPTAMPPLEHRKSFDSLFDDDGDWQPPTDDDGAADAATKGRADSKDGSQSPSKRESGNWLTRLFTPRTDSSEAPQPPATAAQPATSNPFGSGNVGASGGGGGGTNPFGASGTGGGGSNPGSTPSSPKGGSGKGGKAAALKVAPQPHKRPSASNPSADGLSGFYQDDEDEDDNEDNDGPPGAATSNPFGAAPTSYPRTMGAGSTGLLPTSGAPFKIIIVGDSGVGKTSLLVRFVEGRYDGREPPTVAVGVSNAALDLGSSTVGLALWDTAGQERFAPLSAPYFRQADGVIVVFDVGNRTSFERVRDYWLDQLALKAEPDVNVMLVGSKVDLAVEARRVGREEAEDFAANHGWLYFETSALSGVHVRDAFYLLACTVMNRMLENDPKNLINEGGGGSMSLGEGPGAKKECCLG